MLQQLLPLVIIYSHHWSTNITVAQKEDYLARIFCWKCIFNKIPEDYHPHGWFISYGSFKHYDSIDCQAVTLLKVRMPGRINIPGTINIYQNSVSAEEYKRPSKATWKEKHCKKCQFSYARKLLHDVSELLSTEFKITELYTHLT